jgi:hypothetical protein
MRKPKPSTPIQYPRWESAKGPPDEALGNVMIMLRSRVAAIRRNLRKDQQVLDRECAAVEEDLSRLMKIMFSNGGGKDNPWDAFRRSRRHDR